MDLKVQNHMPPYTYLKAKIADVKVNRYEGLSISEIKDKYGKEEAQWVYFMATKGVDLTKHEFVLPEENPYVDVDIYKNRSKYSCHISTTTGEDRMLFEVDIDDTQMDDALVDQIISNTIYDHLRRIGVLN